MNIHEYQAKEILKNFGLPVLQGKSYSKNLDTLHADIEDLNGPPWVVKSQIHAGGRGKEGGVKLVKKSEASEEAKKHFGKVLITPQTAPEGKEVRLIDVKTESYRKNKPTWSKKSTKINRVLKPIQKKLNVELIMVEYE